MDFAEDLEGALARVDDVVREAPTERALTEQHEVRRRLCWMVGVLDPLERRVALLKQQGGGWQEDAQRLVGHFARQLDADRAASLLTLLDEAMPSRPRRWIDRVAVYGSSLRFADVRRCAADALTEDRFDAGEALDLAKACLEAGDAGLATRFVRAAMERAPDDVAALALDGTLHLWSGQLEVAAERAARCRALSPHAAAGRKLAGQVALLRGDARSAVKLFERAAGAQGADAETWVLIAEAYRALGRRAKARAALASARSLEGWSYSFASEANELLLGLSPRWPRPLGQRLLERSVWRNRLDLAGALSALGLAPRYRLDRRPVRAARRSAKKTLNDALDRLSGNRSPLLTRKTSGGGFECVQKGPPVRAACVRVRAALASGGFEAAIEAHDALFEDHGHSPLVYTHRGELRLWWGRYDQAAEDFEIALRLHRWTRWAWAGLGACHLLRGKPVLALATFARARLHAPPALTTHVYAGEAWHRLGRDRRARSAFRKAKALHPGRPSASLGLALTAACLGEAGAVEEHFGDLAATAPGFVRALVRDTGTSREELRRDLDRAREVAERGFEMMRGNRSSGSLTWLDRTGRAYMESG